MGFRLQGCSASLACVGYISRMEIPKVALQLSEQTEQFDSVSSLTFRGQARNWSVFSGLNIQSSGPAMPGVQGLGFVHDFEVQSFILHARNRYTSKIVSPIVMRCRACDCRKIHSTIQVGVFLKLQQGCFLRSRLS